MSVSLDFLSHSNSVTSSRPARRVPAWLLPGGILTGFALVFSVLYQDRLLPASPVDVAVVLANQSQVTEAASGPSAASAPQTVLFQASGWIEPEPFPTKVPCLVDGVVAAVHVLEGQDVQKGQLLVSLVDEDAKLALSTAEGNYRRLVAIKEAHLAATSAMRQKRTVAEKEVAAAMATVSEAEDQLARLERLVKTSAVSQSDHISSRFRLEREKSLHQAALARQAELEAEVRRLELEKQTRESEITLAKVAVEQAALALKRTKIASPMDGRVLRLAAAPGDKKMLSMDSPDSSVVCVLYEPQKLQARVDVPLADAAGLKTGQKTRIQTSLLTGVIFDGEVVRISGEADLQRNTLQAKVRILNPADQLRPEMLCRAEFLSHDRDTPPGLKPNVGAATSLSLWIPAAAVKGDHIWVCNPESKRLSLRKVSVSHEEQDGYRQVTEGLRPGEWIVMTAGNWKENQRVNPKTVEP